jgi:hypothetical protein
MSRFADDFSVIKNQPFRGSPMAEYADREHYIPLRKSDLVALLCRDKHLPAEQREPVRQFCTLASSVFHFEYQQWLEELKDDYAPFNPDSETKPLAPVPPGELPTRLEKVFAAFTRLMERANFKRLNPDEVRQVVHAHAAARGMQTDVDFDVFERLEVFVRGEGFGPAPPRPWWKVWEEPAGPVPLYHRVVLIVKLRPHRRLPKNVRTDVVFLKVFKDIPKESLGMFQPGARVLLTRIDKALIVYPLAFGVGLMLFNVANSVLQRGVHALVTLVSWSVAGAVAGYGYKSYYSYQSKKQVYTLRLTQSLYYQMLDSNTGVLMHLLDEAEEQECRETYLAYYCLWKYAPPEGWTDGQLDDYVELYLEGQANLKVDFEIGDALEKLERLRLVVKSGDRYRAVALEKALEMLDYKWDNYFKYNNPEYEAPPVV